MNNNLTTDQRLILEYKTMFGLDNIDNTSGNTTLQGDVNIASNLYVFNNSNLISLFKFFLIIIWLSLFNISI
jgi:hypothetical protein